MSKFEQFFAEYCIKHHIAQKSSFCVALHAHMQRAWVAASVELKEKEES